MTEFVASNGKKIRHNESGLFFEGSSFNGGDRLSPSQVEALREFFQAERDAELGRWRSKEYQGYAVYPRAVEGFEDGSYRECSVLEESSGTIIHFGSDLTSCFSGYAKEAARAYFAAHPEPKPWQAAKVGEHWQIDVGNKDYEVSVVRDGFDDAEEFICSELRCSIFYTGILAGRRIWPES